MKKIKLVIWVIFFFLLVNMNIFLNENTTVEAKENKLYVDIQVIYPEESDGSLTHPYKYIQNAIDAASNGDIIHVLPGLYLGDIVIDKSITLRSDNKFNTFISGKSKNYYLVDISADSVSIENFTIYDLTNTSHRKAVIHINSDNVNIIGSIINDSYNGYCLHIENSNNTLVINNIINNTKGIKVDNSISTNLFGNTIDNSSDNYAIQISDSNLVIVDNNSLANSDYGLDMKNIKDTTIINNTIRNSLFAAINILSAKNLTLKNNAIKDNSNNGIYIEASSSTIINNSFYNNSKSLYLDSNNCIIANNSFDSNKVYNIFTSSNSYRNHIYDNSFIGKPLQYHAKENGNNYWNNSRDNGNYWDDFYGPDRNCKNNSPSLTEDDFIYKIGGVSDYYPKGVFQQQPEISNPNPSDLSSGVSRNPTLSIKATDPEGKNLNVYFYYLDKNNESKLINSKPIKIASGNTASVNIDPSYSYIGLGYDYFCNWWVSVEDEYSYNYSNATLGRGYIFTTVKTPGYNIPPIANAGDPYLDIEFNKENGAIVNFNGSGCNDTDGTIEFYHWSFGDYNTINNVQSPTHIYKKIGTYIVNLVIIDNHGSSSNATTYVKIIEEKNYKPIAVITGLDKGLIGEKLFFSAIESTDPDQEDIEQLIYQWDFGDGTIDNGSSIFHKFSKAGKYNIVLFVTDPDGEYDTATLEINILKPKKEESPGFEFLILLLSIFLFILLIKNKEKRK